MQTVKSGSLGVGPDQALCGGAENRPLGPCHCSLCSSPPPFCLHQVISCHLSSFRLGVSSLGWGRGRFSAAPYTPGACTSQHPLRIFPNCPRGCCRPGPVVPACPSVVAPPPPWHIHMSAFEKCFPLLGGCRKGLMSCELIWAPLLAAWGLGGVRSPLGAAGLPRRPGCREVMGRAGEGHLSLVALVGWHGGLSRDGTQH